MINEKQIEILIERLIKRIEEANSCFLMKIGSSVGKIKELTTTQAIQLINILKYGGNYEDIIREITKYTNLNIKDIDDIFYNYAKKDQMFYEKFYEYRDMAFIPIEKNYVLKTQTMAFASMIKNEMYNYTRTNMLGYSIKDIDGVSRFYGLRETYNRVLDEALLNVSQGKETFDVSMSRIMKEIGGSGLKTLNYQSGRKIRLDSAVSMHLKDNLQALHNELKNVYGKEFGADGVEISFIVTQLQTMQKYKEEYLAMKNLKSYKMEKWQKIIKINIILDHDNKYGYRPISTMNCYHNTFPIILGINESSYSDEQLQKIIEDNNKGFEFEDKHYTNYQGTQLQRNLDRAIREQKDIQILGKASDNNELIQQSQAKITMLTNKYRKLSKVSGLPNKPNRLRVSEYRRKKVK